MNSCPFYSFLNKESYDAVISTAKEQHMDVIGHIPYALSVEYVVDAGQKMIAHTEEVAKHAHGDYSAERVSYFAGRIKDGGVWLTPTLVTTRSILEEFSNPEGPFPGPKPCTSITRCRPASGRSSLRTCIKRFRHKLRRKSGTILRSSRSHSRWSSTTWADS
jgi:hypothetical protein